MHCKPFDTYIAECQALIRERRIDLCSKQLDEVVAANSPFELRPLINTNGKFRCGALLIHGLLDSPFSLRDIGLELQQAGILCRAVLLPGHGTQPSDLLSVSYQDWIDTVRYGVESLREVVDHIYLIGYSTGASLSIYQAIQDTSIKGIVLLAPALKIQPPTSTIVKWPALANFFSREDKWLTQEQETDYTKYESVPFNPVIQVGKLIEEIKRVQRPLHCSMLTFMSHNDETVSAHAALHFFNKYARNGDRFVLYAKNQEPHKNERVEVRNASHPEWHIKQMSHVAIPFSPNNPHYGQQGDHPDHSNPNANAVYGAYNRLQLKYFDRLYQLGLLKKRRMSLSYNPDFDYMAGSIVNFLTPLP